MTPNPDPTESRMVNPGGDLIAAYPHDFDMSAEWGVYGRVGQILDEMRVVATIGRNDGVRRTDEFVICSFSEPVPGLNGKSAGQIRYDKAWLWPERIEADLTVLKVLTATDHPVRYGDFVRRRNPDVERGVPDDTARARREFVEAGSHVNTLAARVVNALARFVRAVSPHGR